MEITTSISIDTEVTRSTVSILPFDLISSILSRLPVKSLLRFKSVSKTWYNLIESPYFIRKHLTHSKLNPNPICAILSITSVPDFDKQILRLNQINTVNEPVDFVFPFLHEGTRIRVLGVCDGLVCMMLLCNSPSITVCNPLIREFRYIPLSERADEDEDCVYFGFGHSVDNGYELFRMVYKSLHHDELVLGVKAYSLATDTWREIDVKMGKFYNFENHKIPSRSNGSAPVFLLGIFYWEATHDGYNKYIVSFDTEKEIFDQLLGPDDSAHTEWELRALKEELSTVIYHGYDRFNIWMLNENKKSWEIKFNVDCADVDGIITLLGCAASGALVVEYYHEKSNFLFYDTETEEIETLPCVSLDVNSKKFLYLESLVGQRWL